MPCLFLQTECVSSNPPSRVKRSLGFNRKNAQGGQTGENPVADLIPVKGEGGRGKIRWEEPQITEGSRKVLTRPRKTP